MDRGQWPYARGVKRARKRGIDGEQNKARKSGDFNEGPDSVSLDLLGLVLVTRLRQGFGKRLGRSDRIWPSEQNKARKSSVFNEGSDVAQREVIGVRVSELPARPRQASRPMDGVASLQNGGTNLGQKAK
jgi:hypothetical protein